MQAYIYKTNKKEGLYLYLAQKDHFQVLTPEISQLLGDKPIYVMTITLSADKPLANTDVITAMNNLQTHGFHLQLPPTIKK